MRNVLLLLSVASLATVMSCSNDNERDPGKVVLPSNLTYTLEYTSEDSTAVSVTVSADDANFYRVYFGLDEDDFEESQDGILTFTYPPGGEYNVKVQAHTTKLDFISESTTVRVPAGIPNSVPLTGYTTPQSYDGYTLIWQDEFDGTTLNSENWTHELGTGDNGWGNNELQSYRAENTTVGDGHLTIEARQESFGGASYTSSRIVSTDKFEFKYGRVDIRAALPNTQGIWPALWMLGANFSDVGWPACGEIDIMEMIGGPTTANEVFGTLHWEDDASGQRACTCGSGVKYTLEEGDFSEEWHVFTIEWNSRSIKWMVDDNEFYEVDITPAELSEFLEEFFFIFNVAVGGDLPGDPNEFSIFPQRMYVDYVRVFQQDMLTAPIAPAPTPSVSASDVISIYSDAYTDINDVNLNPGWGQNTVVTPSTVSGDNILEIAGLNYQGIDFAGNAQDVSGMTHVHLDVWAAEDAEVNFFLISPGPLETASALTFTPGEWQSIDISLDEFSSVVDLSEVIQFKFDDNGSGAAPSFFVDNMYFYRGGGGGTSPSQAAPVPTASASDVISIYSDSYTPINDVNLNPGWGQNTVFTESAIGGNNMIEYASLNYQGISFENNAQDLTTAGMTHVHLDVWTPNASAVNFFLISPGPLETAEALSITTGSWVSYDFPLDNFSSVVNLSEVIQFKFDDNGAGDAPTIYVDNIYFYKESAGASSPSSAAADPTKPAADVISIYSDAYTQIANVDTNPGWGQNTVVTETAIGGNNMLKLESLNYQGISFENNAQDLTTAGMTHVHLDVWTPDASAVNFFLISPGPLETAEALSITTGSWVGYDIPLSNFSSVVNLSEVIQFKFDDNGAGDSPTLYIDNLYFYK